jgi:LytR cell envelope-related transcriptional attenuator
VAASSSGSRSLLRTGGIALLGVGIIAATVGLFTSVTGGNDAGTAVPSASSQALPATAAPVTPVEPAPTALAAPPTEAAPAPGATAPAVPAVPAVPDGAAARSAPPAAAEPAPAAPAPAAGSGSGSGSGSDGAGARAPLRVYNNSLIQGLAAKAKSDFEAAGWTVTAISGYGEGVVDHSTVYFRPGTPEEAAAHELGREFGLRVEPRFPGIAQSSDGVIVIVTQDYKPIGKS